FGRTRFDQDQAARGFEKNLLPRATNPSGAAYFLTLGKKPKERSWLQRYLKGDFNKPSAISRPSAAKRNSPSRTHGLTKSLTMPPRSSFARICVTSWLLQRSTAVMAFPLATWLPKVIS